ncbi:MAG: hypothetical protein AAGA44_03350 [Pseudomonadota bacterium]
MAKDYRELTRLSGLYRVGRERTSSGLLKLELYYQGIDAAMPESASADSEWQAHLDFIDSWQQLNPAEPAPYIAKAQVYLSRAWSYRGEGWASSVGFFDEFRYKQYTKKARDWLVEHKKAASIDPSYYPMLVHAYRGKSGSKSEALAVLYEGMNRYPNFDPIYFRGAGFLSPKWYGSHEELADFVKLALENTRDERGTEIVARAYWAAGRGGDGNYYFTHHTTDRRTLRQSMIELVDNYPDQWNITHMAAHACWLYDKNLTRHFMEMLEEPVDRSKWLVADNYELCREFAGLAEAAAEE